MSSRDTVVSEIRSLSAFFPGNAFLLFSMGLKLGNTDYEELFRDNVLDGPDDKKVDFFRIDFDSGFAVIAQGFESASWEAVDPPSNKASDLNTATSWLLDAELDNIPRQSVRAAAEELRDALENGDIHTVEVYFVHNCRPSRNVDNEMDTVQSSLRNRLEGWADRAGAPISAVARQLSLTDVISLYDSQYSPIRVTDTVKIRTEGKPQSVSGPNWRATYTTALAQDLVALVQKYGEDIYTADIREYLGLRALKANINRQIAQTAVEDPKDFWVFNNGVSLISRHVEQQENGLECSGIAVMNGAQTLGSLNDASKRTSIQDVKVLVRVVESNDAGLVQQIIRYNNTQNPIKPWELRVLDPVQKRIETDFQRMLNITYQFRRGQSRHAADHILCEKLGPWMNSFYGDPITSHRNSPELFNSDLKYRSLFNDNTDVRHLLFIYRLGEAVGATKDEYREAIAAESANETEAALYGYFRFGAFSHVVLDLCAEMLSELFGGGPNVKGRFALTDPLAQDRQSAIAALKGIVKFTLSPIPSELRNRDAYEQLRSSPGIEGLENRVQVTLNQMKAMSPDSVQNLKQGIELR